MDIFVDIICINYGLLDSFWGWQLGQQGFDPYPPNLARRNLTRMVVLQPSIKDAAPKE